MKRFGTSLACILALAAPVVAAHLWDEYGDPSEMKGLKTIYVDTGEYLDVRKVILEDLKRELPDVSLTSGTEGAELALVFVPRLVKGDDTRTTLYVLRPVGDKIRLLDRYEDWSTHTGSTGFRRTSRVVTRRFVEVYRKAQ